MAADAILAPALESLRPSFHTLQMFVQGDEKLGPAGAAPLAAALQALTGLTRLELGSCLGPGCVAAVGPALLGMRLLRNLDLSYIRMNAAQQDAAALAQALASLASTLKHLALTACGLGPEGMALLAPVLGQTTGLVWLALSDNQLGSQGVGRLVPALKRMRTLRSLGLTGNLLGPGAYMPVAHALSGRDRLPTVSIIEHQCDRRRPSEEQHDLEV